MSDYITLLGSEEVRSSASSISSSAQQMTEAASNMNYAVERLDMVLNNFITELRVLSEEAKNE